MTITEQTPSQLKFCPACGTQIASSSRFCSQCGADLAAFIPKTKTPTKTLAIVAILALAVFAVGWYSQGNLIGSAPSEHYKAATEKTHPNNSHAEQPLDSSLQSLKDAALSNPQEKTGWVNFAQALGERLSVENPPKDLIFEAIGALRHILDIDPKDTDALLTMAEISFQQQAFAKAAEFYQQYLELRPEDLDIRARLASSLSFVGKFDQSLTELERVLTVKPDHFQALAYSAVTYAEMGNKDRAQEVGAKALAIAPSAEAKERFGKFLASLNAAQTPVRGNMPKQPLATASQASFEPAVQAVVDQVKNNPVAGKKFIAAQLVDANKLKISLDNFPVDKMPPFVREKFLGAITEKAFAADSPLHQVILFDDATQQTLETLSR